jgi:hypothetical protein
MHTMLGVPKVLFFPPSGNSQADLNGLLGYDAWVPEKVSVVSSGNSYTVYMVLYFYTMWHTIVCLCPL